MSMLSVIKKLVKYIEFFFRSDAVIFNSTLEKLVKSWTHNVGPLITATQSMAFLDFTNDSVQLLLHTLFLQVKTPIFIARNSA